MKRGHTEGQETYENMLKVTNPLRDANQNNNEVPSHTCQNGYHQQINKQQVLERIGRKKEPSCTAGENADWCSHCGKQYGITS